MTNYSLLKNHLIQNGAFRSEINMWVRRAIECISGEVPYNLKLSIALSELITFTSHLRKHIQLSDGTLVPCNAITFALSASGTAKDSSRSMVNKALKPGYEAIEILRKEEAKEKAEKLAILDGKSNELWANYYEKPKDLVVGLGTVEGVLKHFSSIENTLIGAGSLNTSEIGSELLSNKDMVDIIKTISVGYDLGTIPAKVIKSQENQVDGIKCLPINALFFGSESAILYDSGIKSKFKTIFTTQLARRSIFSFTPEIVSPPEFKTIKELTDYRNREREQTNYAQTLMKNSILEIISNTNQEPLKLTDKAQELFDVYKEYNQLEAETMKTIYPINKIARKHKQWLVLKLSGNLAILDKSEVIEATHYIQALNITEYFSNDLMLFEQELVKEQYEAFSEFCKHEAQKGKYTIGLHALRKLGYIPMTGGTKTKVEELVHLASSYDPNAIYLAFPDGISYEEQIKTDTVGISYIEVSGTKQQRAKNCYQGFEFYDASFDQLDQLLTMDTAYSPFEFRDGYRKNENIISGTKLLVLDIDTKQITDKECHFMLSDINHHIARTSNGNDEYKFRVLIELDATIDLEDIEWSYFLQEASEELGLIVDPLPKSQIFFSYAEREVLSVLDGSPLTTKPLIVAAMQKVANKPKPKKPTKTEQKTMLEDKLETFGFAFNAKMGEGGRPLIRAARYAKDLGASLEYTLDLMQEISNYWIYPMEEKDLGRTVLNQIKRWY